MNEPARHSLRKRLLAAALSTLLPGVGHYLLGATRAGLVLVGALIVFFVTAVLAATGDSAWLFWPLAGCAIGVQLALIVHPLTLRRGTSPGLWRTVGVGVVLLLTWQVLRTAAREFVVESFRTPSQSMAPGLPSGSLFFVSKLDKNPSPGDVIAYRLSDTEDVYMKRVIAMPGQTIATERDSLIVNGHPVPEARVLRACTFAENCQIWKESLAGRSYETVRSSSDALRFIEETKVPEDSVYVLGDHRDNSHDSRQHGPVPLSNIVGTLSFIWWSAE